MTALALRIGALLLVGGVLASACQSTTSVTNGDESAVAPEPTSTVVVAQDVAGTDSAETEPTVGPESLTTLSPDLSRAVENLADGYRAVAAAWDGFAPNEHPVVLVVNNSNDEPTGALAINHPAPGILGDATQLDIAGTPFTSLHLVQTLNGEANASLREIRTFEFDALVGGASTFLMIAGGSDPFFDPTTKRYVSTLLHEMFHRHQGDVFRGEVIYQDIDGYDFSAASLELIALEDRALTAALQADTNEAKRDAARFVVAIRHYRVAADSRVLLDNSQELHEGTARFVEHQLGGADTSYDYHLGNFDQGLITDISMDDVKGNLAFGRWYASGAAILHLLAELSVEDVEEQVEAGNAPIQILAQIVDVDESDIERLVNEARTTYDPSNELAEQAAKAAEAVLAQPPFWSEGDGGNDSSGAEELPTVEISDALVACLESKGVDFSATQVDIRQEDWDECNASTE